MTTLKQRTTTPAKIIADFITSGQPLDNPSEPLIPLRQIQIWLTQKRQEYQQYIAPIEGLWLIDKLLEELEK